jgi:hypothetical protein
VTVQLGYGAEVCRHHIPVRILTLLDCSQNCFQLPGRLLPTSIIYPPTPFDLIRTQKQLPRAGEFSEKFICVGNLKNGQSAVQGTTVFTPYDGTRESRPPARGGTGAPMGGGPGLDAPSDVLALTGHPP